MVAVLTLVLLAAVAAVAGIGVVRVARRNLLDERSSVRHYQHTLETLRHLSGVGGEQVRTVPDPCARAPHDVATSHPAPTEHARPIASPVLALAAPDAPERQENGAPGPAEPTVATRATTAADAVRQLVATGARYRSGATRPIMPSPRRRHRRPLAATVAAVVVVGTVTGVAVALRPAPRSVASPPTAHHQSGTAAPATAKKPSPKKKPSSKRSSSAVPGGLVPVTASTTAATYDVAGSPFSVTLTATGPCWVEAVETATGQVMWEGTLEGGSTQIFPSTSGLFLRLGNAPDVTVTEGGQTVQLPPGYNIVFDLTFVTA